MKNKQKLIRWELVAAVAVAYALVVGASFYFFHSMSENMDRIQETTYRAQEKLGILHSIESQMLEIEQLKTRYFVLNDQFSFESINSTGNAIDHAMRNLKAGFENDSYLLEQIKDLESTISPIANLAEIEKQKNEDIDKNKRDLIAEHSRVSRHITTIRESLISLRNTQNETIYATAHRTKTLAYLAIGLPLLFILYIANRVIRINKQLRINNHDAEQLNTEYQAAQEKINITNWILREINVLNEKLNGVNDEKDIAKLGFEVILQSTQFLAGALYIKKSDTQEYVLREQLGIDNVAKRSTIFLDGEGLRGRATKSQEMIILDQDSEQDIIRSSSDLSPNALKKIILAPFVYENRSWGLLEIGGDFRNENELEKVTNYLQRVTRTLAVCIKFGQNHMLLENLLEETQQQTEELEAQQEELRITNEELIYKTNLLEASEEELRVQQEELQQINQELQEKAKQLESRNDELNTAQQTVEQKIQEVEQASKYKSEFMANMSHELRTPLNSILILAKLLRDNKGKNLHEDQVKYASVIHSAGSDLLSLINSLLDLAKIESGKIELNFEQIQTSFFAKTLENLFSATAQEKDITFNIDIDKSTPVEFVSDEHRLEQILKNFLSNAFKFTERHGHVQLSITGDQEHLKFTVIDDGKGIPTEKQSLIFEAFHQEDGSTSRKYGGTGLGLSISREIASLLGGRITLKSEINKGSAFTLTIPFKQVVHASTATPQIQPSPLPTAQELQTEVQTANTVQEVSKDRLKIKSLLIIEDDFNFAEILKEFATRYGFEVTLAHDGADGIKKAKELKPHAIILDVMLPLSDGWEVLRTLKADIQTKHIPIHMMSASDYNQRDFIEHGAIGFLSKPVSEISIQKAFENIRLNIKEGVKRVLLIEDQEFQSDIIKSAFAEQNINVIQAFTAQSGLTKLEEEENIDCIILDIKLPDANGLELLDDIKSMEKYQDIPIIINTAYDLSKEQIDHIHQHTKAMVLKSSKSNNRLIDEVTLFLNKLSSNEYISLQNMDKLEHINKHQDSLKGKHVLIADDDMRNVFALTTALQQYDMHIEIANNGIEALQIINNPDTVVDIVLMDVMMPEMDGYEAIEKIRGDKRNINLPIIAVTAKAMKGDREKSIQVGANDYISKPIDMDKLVSLIRVWLS